MTSVRRDHSDNMQKNWDLHFDYSEMQLEIFHLQNWIKVLKFRAADWFAKQETGPPALQSLNTFQKDMTTRLEITIVMIVSTVDDDTIFFFWFAPAYQVVVCTSLQYSEGGWCKLPLRLKDVLILIT